MSGVLSPKSARRAAGPNGMTAYTEYFVVHTRARRELLHLTPTVEAFVQRSGLREGFVLVSAMHITAGVFVNDNESGLHGDIWRWLEQLAPARDDYAHHATGEDNGDAHLKSLLVQHEVTVPLTEGALDLGTWQRVFYAEFDGRRDKRLLMKVLGF